MRVAAYVRVSTTRQVQAQTIDQQLERLRAHLASRHLQLTDALVFRDDGYSGATLKRPGLDRLRDAAANAELDLIVITDPDRLARNFVHQTLLLDELGRFGCQVEFLDRPMTQDPHDQLLLQIRGAVAEYERTLITERMRRGRLAKLRAGMLLPWTRPPYGYRADVERPRDPAGVRIDPAEGAIVAELFAWYLQDGNSLTSVAVRLHQLRVPSPTGKERWGLASIRGILTNPAYAGQVFAGRTHYRTARIRRSATIPIGTPHQTGVPAPPDEWIPVATIPAIVDQQQFDLVQEKLRHNQSFARRNNTANQYLLRALVSCGACKLACMARKVHPSYRYYVCSGKARAVLRPRPERCASRFAPAGQLDELVWNDLCEVITHPEIIAHALERAHGGHWLPQELQARRENLRKGQAELGHQLERLTQAYLGGVVPLAEYERRRSDIERRVQALEQQARQLDTEVDQQAHLGTLITSTDDFCLRVQRGLSTATFEQKRQLVELLIDRVVVSDGEVEIRYVVPTGPRGAHVRFCHLRTDYFGDPEVIESAHVELRHEIRVDRQSVRRIRRDDEGPSAQA